MATFTGSDDLQGARFVGSNLRGARFIASDLSGALMRGVEVNGTSIDAPWLSGGRDALLVNDVDVTPYVEGELNRRFPGRSERRAADPDGLRRAWAKLEQTWAASLDRVAAMPPGTVDISVNDEWTFAQTLRHLILATDMWLGKAVLEKEQPFHPLGLMDAGTDGDNRHDRSVFATEKPTYDAVLEARQSRVAMVRDFLAGITEEELTVTRRNPHEPAYPETTRSCIHVILEEEWEHHRYAVRDLGAIARGAA